MTARTTRLWPVLAGGVAFALYVRTLYPGLVSIGDSPKFQFVGRIWGTPHNPGYPLYVVVSHLFSVLPIDTLAYRINLMSAVFGALTVALLAVAIGRLTGSALAGAGGGLILAFGRVFWSQATVAEVYTLASALLAATLCFLLEWEKTRRARDLFLAVGCVALAAGNHLTVVMVAPALALFVLATDWKAALRPRVILVSLAILVVGVAQYGLIIYWTSRHPPYLESSATTVSELFAVMSVRQFSGRAFTEPVRTLALDKNLALFDLFLQEMRPWGVALAAIGAVLLVVRRRWPVVALLGVASVTVWFFVLNYEVADPQVFLIPVFVMAALAAGVTLAWFENLLGSRGRLARLAAVVIALSPAVVLASTNYRVSDHHRRTFETRLFNAMFRQLPDNSVVVPGTFAEYLMLTYKLEGERAAKGGRVERAPMDADAVRRLWQKGFGVFVFPGARDELSRRGLTFEPVVLWDETLPQILQNEPDGRIVALAGLGLGAFLPPQRGPSLPQIGGTAVLSGRDDYAAIGVTGADGGALEAVGTGALVRADRGQRIDGLAGSIPVNIEARSAGGGTIIVNGSEAVSAPYAVAFAILEADGRVLRRGIADPSHELRARFDGDPQLFHLVNVRECLDVGNMGWRDISTMASRGHVSGRIDNYRPFDSRVRFVVSSDTPLNPRLTNWQGPATRAFTVEQVSAAALARVAFAGEVPAGTHTYVVELQVNDHGEWVTFTIELGGIVRGALASASVDLNNPRRATLCAGESM